MTKCGNEKGFLVPIKPLNDDIAELLTNEILTSGQVAKICQVAPRTVSKWIDNKALKGFRLPLSLDRRVARCDLIEFLKNNGFPTQLFNLDHRPSVQNRTLAAAISNLKMFLDNKPFDAEALRVDCSIIIVECQKAGLI